MTARSSVHPTVIVESGVTVGCGTSIWHHSHIREGAVIGEGCTLGKNVYIDRGVQVGRRVKIQNNVSVYRGVELADDVFIGQAAVFTNDLRPRAASEEWQVTPTWVRAGASIGANATVICGTEIGERSMVGAGAVVTSSVRPHQLVMGNPARHHGWVCGCGEVVSRAAAQPPDMRCSGCRAGSKSTLAGPRLARIPLAKVVLGPAEERAALGVMRSGELSGGEHVAELERCFAETHDAQHAVAVCNGTVALVAALRAHDVGPGDEVITSPLTFAATLNAILEVGATARFADVTEDLTLDPSAVAAMITPRTKALIPVHLYGLPAAMDELTALASRRGLVLIEDAAQAHGARSGGRPVGSWDTAAFSLYATKNVTCGEGGVITTNDGAIAERLRLLRNQGMRSRYDYALPGYNYRLTDLQAAIAVVQLRRLNTINEQRTRNAARLSCGLSGIPGLVLPSMPDGRQSVWHQYTVRLTAEARMDRDQLSKWLEAANIDSRSYYPKLVHDYPCYANHPGVARDVTPQAGAAVGQVLSLPVHPALTDSDLSRIVDTMREALAR